MNSSSKNQKTAKPKPKKQAKARKAAKAPRAITSIDPCPVANSYRVKSDNPKIVTSDGKVRVTHRELISEIQGANSTAFVTSVNVPIQPGSSAYPWLSMIANNYEQWVLIDMVYEFIPRSSTLERGTIKLIPEYDANDSGPLNATDASSYHNMTENSVWRPNSCQIDARAAMQPSKRKYTRTRRLFNVDVKLYDGGRFFLCQSGVDTADIIGDLWCDYVIDLYVPQVPTKSPPESQTMSYLYNSGVQSIPASTTTRLRWTNTGTNALGVTLTNSQTVINLLPGFYLLQWDIQMNVSIPGSAIFAIIPTAVSSGLTAEFLSNLEFTDDGSGNGARYLNDHGQCFIQANETGVNQFSLNIVAPAYAGFAANVAEVHLSILAVGN